MVGNKKACAVLNSPLSERAPCQPVPDTAAEPAGDAVLGEKGPRKPKMEKGLSGLETRSETKSVEKQISRVMGQGQSGEREKKVRPGSTATCFAFSLCRLPSPSMHLPYLTFNSSKRGFTAVLVTSFWVAFH